MFWIGEGLTKSFSDLRSHEVSFFSYFSIVGGTRMIIMSVYIYIFFKKSILTQSKRLVWSNQSKWFDFCFCCWVWGFCLYFVGVRFPCVCAGFFSLEISSWKPLFTLTYFENSNIDLKVWKWYISVEGVTKMQNILLKIYASCIIRIPIRLRKKELRFKSHN